MLLLRRPQRHPSGTDGTNSVPRCESALRPRISSKTARGGCRGFQKRSHFANVTDTAKHFRAPLLQMPRTCTRWGTQPSSRMRSFNVCFIFSLGGWRCFGTPFLNYGHLRFLGCRETNHLIFFFCVPASRCSPQNSSDKMHRPSVVNKRLLLLSGNLSSQV